MVGTDARGALAARILCAIGGGLCALSLVLSPTASAEAPPSSREFAVERARLTLDSTGSLRRVALPTVALAGGSELTVITPSRWSSIGAQLSSSLTEAHSYFASLFGEIPPIKTSVRLMEEESFYVTTGAPSWTNALFLRGEILIPLPSAGPVDTENLTRSLKHEYSHAVLHALSGGRAPGWLDEGLAQWVEGSENESLRPALYHYLRRSNPVPFALLQGGFTRLESKMVPAAYAQSLYAARSLISGGGFTRIGNFLTLLRRGNPQEVAFRRSFGISEETFEERFSDALTRWSRAPTSAHLASYRPPSSVTAGDARGQRK